MTVILALTLAYLAGRIHGYSKAQRFLAAGFRTMQRTAEQRGIPEYEPDAQLWTAAEVCRAFGTHRSTR